MHATMVHISTVRNGTLENRCMPTGARGPWPPRRAGRAPRNTACARMGRVLCMHACTCRTVYRGVVRLLRSYCRAHALGWTTSYPAPPRGFRKRVERGLCSWGGVRLGIGALLLRFHCIWWRGRRAPVLGWTMWRPARPLDSRTRHAARCKRRRAPLPVPVAETVRESAC